MSTSLKMVIVLTLIATISGAMLSSWDNFTMPRIQEHRQRELIAAISDVLPEHDHYDEVVVRELTLYVGKNEGNEPLGIAFQATGSGFQGKISMMVGVEPDFSKLTGITILEQIETPGLGTKIVEDRSNKVNPFWFSDQFRSVHTYPEITVVKNKKPERVTEIQAITGATISSKSIVKIINDTVQKARSEYQKFLDEVS